MDFGLGLDLEGKDPYEGAIYVGTPGYIAPEVLSNGAYSAKSDIFSLGVVLYILLSGKVPFPGNTATDVNAKTLSGDLKFKNQHWKGISTNARDLVERMLSVDPNERISGQELLDHSWLKSKWDNSLYNSIVGLKDYSI